MSNDIFAAMQAQLEPSQEAQQQLKNRLERPAGSGRSWIYPAAALAACAVFALSVFNMGGPARLHSYTVVGDDGVTVAEETNVDGERAEGALVGLEAGLGGPLISIIEEPKQDKNIAYVEPLEDPNEDGTGQWDPEKSYDGAMINTVPAQDGEAQEGAMTAYMNLMAEFEAQYGKGKYPDWYGGSYIGSGDLLIVNLTYQYSDDKDLCIQIEDMAQSVNIGFSDCKYSLNQLLELNDKVLSLDELKGIGSWSCGVNEIEGRVELTVESCHQDLLKVLAKLDPDDDAIHLSVGKIIAE